MADMTSAAPNTTNPTARIGQALWAPFRAIGNGLIALAEAGPRMDQLRRLNQLSDEQLSARGTSREAEVRRIFGGSIYG